MENLDYKNSEQIRKALKEIYIALREKGYDPTRQIAGYILSEDPVYITDWNNARGKISHINRDDLLEEIIRSYLVGMDNSVE
ncbi:MAG: IreB family regulatory phosphoprotein [Clostridia bacterium]|nr:IreB family regulatory phosphoprotein [Clostridia bacterium]